MTSIFMKAPGSARDRHIDIILMGCIKFGNRNTAHGAEGTQKQPAHPNVWAPGRLPEGDSKGG